ncbi:hypothetical protein J7J18_00865 [bacterium]|nr:hypothetical protein [bacterium]
MARYKIYDCFRGEYLDETQNYAEDLPAPKIGWHVHIEDAAGLTGTLIFVATPLELPESLERCEKEVRFENGKLDTDIVCGTYVTFDANVSDAEVSIE